MKSKLFKIPKTGAESFVVQVDKLDRFYDSRHYHPELQITLILKGSGTRFIGDSIERFEEGDLFLIGPNLPHVFRNEDKYITDEQSYAAASISIYLNKEVFGKEFYALPETKNISELISKSYRGIQITGDTRKILVREIEKIVSLKGFNRVLGLLSILNILSDSTDTSYISSMSFVSPQKESDNKKINDVFEYVMQNYDQDIRLEKVAGIANMATTAFCRYFKSRTRNTFSEFLLKIRVGQACRLLMEEDLSISQVCFQSGFNNLSNFNRQFKTVMGYTPTGYLNRLKKN